MAGEHAVGEAEDAAEGLGGVELEGVASAVADGEVVALGVLPGGGEVAHLEGEGVDDWAVLRHVLGDVGRRVDGVRQLDDGVGDGVVAAEGALGLVPLLVDEGAAEEVLVEPRRAVEVGDDDRRMAQTLDAEGVPVAPIGGVPPRAAAGVVEAGVFPDELEERAVGRPWDEARRSESPRRAAP